AEPFGRVYRPTAVIDPRRAATIARPNRTIRGGAWNYVARNVHAAFRNARHHTARSEAIGFRVVRMVG
ncbi:MAG: hypothetical protein AAFV29_11780, partial [Myxococcota bacterium]